MSETTGIITIGEPLNTLVGSCGSPVKGIDVKIGDNDEILVKGDNVFSGYYKYCEYFINSYFFILLGIYIV